MRELTANQMGMLRAAASSKLSVVERPYLPGFEGVAWDRNAKRLCERGYLKPYVHGGFEITNAGRSILAACEALSGAVPSNKTASAVLPSSSESSEAA